MKPSSVAGIAPKHSRIFPACDLDDGRSRGAIIVVREFERRGSQGGTRSITKPYCPHALLLYRIVVQMNRILKLYGARFSIARAIAR